MQDRKRRRNTANGGKVRVHLSKRLEEGQKKDKESRGDLID